MLLALEAPAPGCLGDISDVNAKAWLVAAPEFISWRPLSYQKAVAEQLNATECIVSLF